MKFIKEIMIAALLLLVGGFVIEQIAQYYYQYTYPPIGKLIEIDGKKIHLSIEGNNNKSLIFIPDLNSSNAYIDFYPLQEELSALTKTVLYDKPGHGWSEPSEKNRDIDTTTQELYEVITASGAKPPYILFAYGTGSLEALRFAQIYSNDVKAILLVDSYEPQYYIKNKNTINATDALKSNALYFANQLFITRLLFATLYDYSLTPLALQKTNFEQLPKDLKKIDEINFIKNYNNKNQISEKQLLVSNSEKVIKNNTLKDIPIVIITNDEKNTFKMWSNKNKQIIINYKRLYWPKYYTIKKELISILNS